MRPANSRTWERTAAIEQALDRALAAATPPAADKDDLAPKLLAAFQIEHKEHLEEIRNHANRERVNRDAERERLILEWDLGYDETEG